MIDEGLNLNLYYCTHAVYKHARAVFLDTNIATAMGNFDGSRWKFQWVKVN